MKVNYRKSLEYWEVKNVKDTSFEEGKEQGKVEEKYNTAKALKNKQLSIEFVFEITGLTEEEINGL